MAKMILGGPAQSGKSCLRAGLKEAIRAIPGASYPYVITGCPDGEGAWFTETAAADPTLARELKEAYKAKFTPEFATRIAESVEACNLPLTFVDIGGKITDENRTICAPATHAVLIAGDKDGVDFATRLEPWLAFCAELGLEVVAILYSDYHGTEDRVEGVGADGVFRASVHFLDRKVAPCEVAKRRAVKALAEYLVERFGKEE